MTASVLTAANWPLVGQICMVLGKVMAFIYDVLDKVLPSDAGLVGLSIIVYTILVYTLMLPMTIQQQKTSRLTAVIQPEIQEIQKKYRNKKDQASMVAQQEEIQRVYDKYGTSMMGGCLPLLIQMPFLFALYPVIYRISEYVPAIKTAPAAVNSFLTIPDLTVPPSHLLSHSTEYGMASGLVIFTAILLPVLSGASQYFNITLSQKVMGNNKKNAPAKDDPMANSMKTMNYTMPLFSVFMVFTLPTGIGLYWIVSALVRSVQMVVINKRLNNMSLEDIVEKNKEKAEKKAAKRGERNERVNQMAQTSTKNLSKSASSAADLKEREAKIEAARKNAKPGSLASKANMVRDFNDTKK